MFGSLDPRNWLAAGLALALLLAGATAAVQTMRVAILRGDLAVEKEGRATEARLAAEAAARASEAARAAERQHATAQQEIVDAYRKEVADRDAAVAAARADADGLRDEIERYASGGGGQPAASGSAACGDYRDRAATLGRLLERSRSVVRRLAEAAEKHAGEVRLLKHQVETDRAACSPEEAANDLR